MRDIPENLTLLAFVFVFLFTHSSAQRLSPQTSATDVRLRGVSAVDANVGWASGEKGTYLRTTDGGRTWRAKTVPGAQDLDFRDIEAFDENTAYVLSAGQGERSQIYKTIDGGQSWVMQYRSNQAQAFFDAIAFWDRNHGLALSDPVDGRFLIVATTDGGATWSAMPREGMPPALEGEGAFAASGTCLIVQGKSNAWFGTGGPNGARVFRTSDGGKTWQVAIAPLAHGKSAGIFSLAFRDARHGMAVGGDYAKEQEAKGNVAITFDGGATWKTPDSAPSGFRSGVVYARAKSKIVLVSAGPSGGDYSSDDGRHWRSMGGREGYDSLSIARKNAGIGWASGAHGRLAKFDGAAAPD